MRQFFKGKRARGVVFGVAAALFAVIAPAGGAHQAGHALLDPRSSGGSDVGSSPYQLAFEPSPRFDRVGWTKAPMPRIRALSEAVGRHTVMVVPLTGPMNTPRADQERVLREVADFWKQAVPGMSLRFIIKEPVVVSEEYCADPGKSWKVAERVAGSFDPYARHNHLAAVVDCGSGSGLGDVRTGSGLIWVNGWRVDSLAHEFGHNLGLLHANSVDCRDWARPAPKLCDQVEYEDHFDVMGGAGRIPMEFKGLQGLWRAWLIGVQRLPATSSATVILTRMATGRDALPLLVKSRIGPIFLDAGPEPPSSGACLTGGVELRVGTFDGRSEPEGQARLVILTTAGRTQMTADFLDAFTIPGTTRRAVVMERTGSTVTVRVISNKDSSRPFVPDLSDVPLGPVVLTDPWADPAGTFRLPEAAGILGYLVESSTDCLKRVAPGQDFDIALAEGDNDLTVTPIGTNGLPGSPVKRTVTVRFDIPEDGIYFARLSADSHVRQVNG